MLVTPINKVNIVVFDPSNKGVFSAFVLATTYVKYQLLFVDIKILTVLKRFTAFASIFSY